MPKIARYTFAWSPLHQAYELHESQGRELLDIVSESRPSLEWVSQISSFAFHGRNGSYTACKECKQRGEGYWYAYARVGGKMTKRYLGRDIGLTLPLLEQVAQELRLDTPDTPLQKEGTALSRSSDSLVPLSTDIAVSPASAQRSHHPVRRQGGSPADQKTRPAFAGLPADLLLATKLRVPRPRPHLVHRHRLIQRLEQGMERALTLISVPVGFGKSTLLSGWLASCAIPVAWLSLEPQDNEPVRFLSYLLAALQSYDPHLGTIRQVLHHPLQPPSMETVLTLLINDLLIRRVTAQEHVVLVLDNYQVVTLESIHDALSFLLEHLPPQVHLVLATREDPPLPLAQLRGRDDLLEIRASDLRFTQEEAATFLVEMMGLPLSTQESGLLHTRTERE